LTTETTPSLSSDLAPSSSIEPISEASPLLNSLTYQTENSVLHDFPVSQEENNPALLKFEENSVKEETLFAEEKEVFSWATARFEPQQFDTRQFLGIPLTFHLSFFASI